MTSPNSKPNEACTVRLNGVPCEVADGTTLAELIALQGHAAHEVATAVNGEFVPRGERAAFVLRSDVQVTCFQPIVGG